MGIVHADLKPDNVMFGAGPDNNYMVKIIDFGWAFHIEDAHTLRGTSFQAVAYRAPEVISCTDVDYGVDVWSLGCIMSEMLTGRILFDTQDEEHLVELIKSTFTVSGDPSLNTRFALTEGCIRFQVSALLVFFPHERNRSVHSTACCYLKIQKKQTREESGTDYARSNPIIFQFINKSCDKLIIRYSFELFTGK